MNLGFKRMVLTPGLTIFRGILTASVVYLGFGLVGVSAAPLVMSLLAGILYWGTVRRYLPWFGIVRPTVGEIRRFFSFSGWFFSWTLISKIMLSIDVVVLGIVATPELVTVYTLTGYAAQTVVGIMAMVIGAVIPGLGGLIGKEEFEKAATVRGEMMAANWLLAMSIGVSILVWNRSFVDLWVGSAHYAGPLADLLIVLAATQLTFIRNDAFIIDLTLNLRRKVILGGLSTLFSIGLAAILIKPLGIVGLCLGLIGGRSILTVSYPLIVRSALEISPKVRLLSLIRPGLVMGVTFGLSILLSQRLFASGWTEFIGGVSLTFVLTICVGFVSGLTRQQKGLMVSRLTRVRFLSGA
jgi:O-antigen/teichoic acid export membrane protein